MYGQKISSKLFLPGIAWFFVVAILVFTPGDDLPKVKWLDIPYLDKLVHATLFGGLTFLFCLPFLLSNLPYKRKVNLFVRISLSVIIWGITVEIIQKFFVRGRGFELLDWAADSAGVLIALWICKKIAGSRLLK